MSGGARTPFLATSAGTAYRSLNRLPVTVLLDNVRSAYNVGSFFRTCDGVRAERLLLGGITAYPPSQAISKTALGAEDSVPWRHAWDILPWLDEVRQAGQAIAAVETAESAVDLYDWQPRFPVCVVFGHETDGVREEVARRCDTFVRIPMLGVKHSLNVATAGGVLLYELLRKYRGYNEAVRFAI